MYIFILKTIEDMRKSKWKAIKNILITIFQWVVWFYVIYYYDLKPLNAYYFKLIYYIGGQSYG